MKKAILSGNEAIARGAFEAGVRVASAYPGTPSTEILENVVNYPTIDALWAPNEKVSLEVGIGASFGGARALVTMKHVGLNVAADPLDSRRDGRHSLWIRTPRNVSLSPDVAPGRDGRRQQS